MNKLTSLLLTAGLSWLGQTLLSLNKLFSATATLSMLCVASMNGSAQTLTLDDFKSKLYEVSLKNAQAQDIHFEALPPGSRLGPDRETVLALGPNPFAQLSTLYIGNGICILDAGFGVVPGVQIYYGWASNTQRVPLGLNLSGYSAFRLNFAGVSTSESLGVEIAVWLHSGSVYAAQAPVLASPNAFAKDFPFSSFGLTQADMSDIDTIGIVIWGGGTMSYGITSFQAVN